MITMCYDMITLCYDFQIRVELLSLLFGVQLQTREIWQMNDPSRDMTLVLFSSTFFARKPKELFSCQKQMHRLCSTVNTVSFWYFIPSSRLMFAHLGSTLGAGTYVFTVKVSAADGRKASARVRRSLAFGDPAPVRG